MGSLLRRVADWCVPGSALRWGTLTGIDHKPSWSFGPDGRGHVYAAGQTYPVLAAEPSKSCTPRVTFPLGVAQVRNR